jgi:hypothetical protein
MTTRPRYLVARPDQDLEVTAVSVPNSEAECWEILIGIDDHYVLRQPLEEDVPPKYAVLLVLRRPNPDGWPDYPAHAYVVVTPHTEPGTSMLEMEWVDDEGVLTPLGERMLSGA